MMSAFRILLADDHPIVRLGLRSVLSSHAGWEVCGEAADGKDAVKKCMQLKPDLLILDVCMPTLDGMDAVREIAKNNPNQRILIFSDADSEKVVRYCLQAGVRGWILKSDRIDDLMTALEALQPQNWILGAGTPAILVHGRWKGKLDPVSGSTAAKAPQLSRREREVLQLLAEGRSSKEVAIILDIAVKTAEAHRNNLMSKLNLHSTAKLVVYAVRNEVVSIGPGFNLAGVGNTVGTLNKVCPSHP
jgi:DNA-binding NarL/FixJ family response regulator